MRSSIIPPDAYALITGASGGIGRELARVFAAQGHRVILLARTREPLESLARELGGSSKALVIVKDLAETSAAVSVYEEVRRLGVAVGVLVNNAGFGAYGRFGTAPERMDRELLQVNLVSLIELTKLFLKDMQRTDRGRILNIASTAAFQPGPGMALYYASKAFVLSFSLALSEELRGSGVTVTALCPGPTDTGFQDRAGISQAKLMSLGRMSAQRVARAGYAGLMKKKRLVIPGLRNQAVATVVPLMPRGAVLRLVKWLHR